MIASSDRATNTESRGVVFRSIQCLRLLERRKRRNDRTVISRVEAGRVYGPIAFDLAHKDEEDRYLEQRRTDYEAKRQAARDADPMFYQRLAEARRQSLTSNENSLSR